MSNEDRCLLIFQQTKKVHISQGFSIYTQSAGKKSLGSAKGMTSRFSVPGPCKSKVKSYLVYMPFSLPFYTGKWMLPYWAMKMMPYLAKDHRWSELKGAQDPKVSIQHK